MLFAYDMVLVDKTKLGLSVKLEAWKRVLGMWSNFSLTRNRQQNTVKIGDHMIPNEGQIEEDVIKELKCHGLK